MRDFLRSAAIAATFAGALMTSAQAGFVQQVFRFTFDDLGAGYTFSTPNYLSSLNPNVGIQLNSTRGTPRTVEKGSQAAPQQPGDHHVAWEAQFTDPYPYAPLGTVNGSVSLEFVGDLTITAYPNPSDPQKPRTTLISSIEFASFGDIADFRATGGTGGQLPCSLGTWCDQGPFNLAVDATAVPLKNSPYKGVESVTLSATAGTIDDIIVTLVYEEAGGGGTAPEPGSMALVLAGLVGAIFFGRGRRLQSAR